VLNQQLHQFLTGYLDQLVCFSVAHYGWKDQFLFCCPGWNLVLTHLWLVRHPIAQELQHLPEEIE